MIQGTTISKFAEKFKLFIKGKNKSAQTMELVTVFETNYELIEVEIDENIFLKGCLISELNMEKDATITMINRKNKIIVPSGEVKILPGDIVFLLVQHEKIDEVTENILAKFS